VHTTGYSYETPVRESYNEARLTPRSDNRQNVIVSRVETTPATRSYRYADYWGTTVTAFDLHAPHTELAVTATSVVETADALAPARSATWEELAGEEVRDRYTEMLEFTDYVERNRDLARVARALKRGKDPADAVLCAARWVREHLSYQPGTTGVHTGAVEAWEARTGVCQDFAHLTLLLVREMGVPARYVSGYLLPSAATEIVRPCAGRATPGSRPGRAAGGATTPPTTSRSATGTCGWPSGATTPTCRRSRGCTPGASRRRWT
jgi:transglutaminase-like putative cysteine protease